MSEKTLNAFKGTAEQEAALKEVIAKTYACTSGGTGHLRIPAA